MTHLIGVVLALWLSFAIVMVPRGMVPTMPEFWLTPWLYGAPVLLLAWPLYLNLFRRMRGKPWWLLAIVGAALSPIPFFVLIVATAALKGQLPTGYGSSYYVPWNSIFTVWYAVFGALLGAWVSLTPPDRSIHQPRASSDNDR